MCARAPRCAPPSAPSPAAAKPNAKSAQLRPPRAHDENMLRRPLRLLTCALCLFAMALIAVGCGQTSADVPPGAITITHNDGAADIATVTVACAEHPDVCATVAEVAAAPQPDACTMIYGGPERINVRGTVGSGTVDLTVGRTNGCDIARYDTLADVLGDTSR